MFDAQIDYKQMCFTLLSIAEDAIEFIMAGATGVSIGTANFINPTATIDTIKGIEEFMDKNNIKTLDEIRGIID